jgi:hypothetical protein
MENKLVNPCTMKESHNIGYFMPIISENVIKCALRTKHGNFRHIVVIPEVYEMVRGRPQCKQRFYVISKQMAMREMSIAQSKGAQKGDPFYLQTEKRRTVTP